MTFTCWNCSCGATNAVYTACYQCDLSYWKHLKQRHEAEVRERVVNASYASRNVSYIGTWE